MSLITASNVHRGYSIGKKRIEVLHGVDLTIEKGEKVFLCGPSGAGKTTLMYTLAGLEKPEQGTVHIGDQDLYALSKRKQAKLRNARISYIFQNYYLMPELTALENVMVPALIGGKSDAAAAKSALDRVGLSHRYDHLPTELSGGEQQRVALARAFAGDPAVLFADEPTGNLDADSGRRITDLLFALRDRVGSSLLLVTHDQQLARRCDRVLQIDAGRLQEAA